MHQAFQTGQGITGHARRLAGILMVAALFVVAPPAFAQPFPNQPVRFIVPYGVGGGPDSLTRLVGEYLQKTWGQPVIVENKPGAAGAIGFDAASRAKPDGYTVMFADSTIVAINPNLRPQAIKAKGVFDVFAPVTLASTAPMLLVVSPKFPAKSLPELVALVKSQPGKFSYTTPGTGTPQFVAMEWLMHETGMRMFHVPFGSVQKAMPSMISGDVAMGFATAAPVLGLLKSGELRAVAIGGSRRLPAAPDVPTFTEAGWPSIKSTINFGYLVPAGTPAEAVRKLQHGIAAALRDPGVASWITAQGMVSVGSTPEEFLAVSQGESKEYGAIIKETGIKVD